jgi:HAD superfamily hydrolase (TIGR01509 family)
MIKAVIFDMDGVMIDSERLYREACTEIVGRYGGAITPELFEKQMGLKMEETQRVVVEIADLPLTPQEFGKMYIERFLEIARERLGPNPGLVELLEFLSPRVKLGIASSTEKGVIMEIVEQIGVGRYFQAIVGGDEISRSKPDPAIYLHAAGLLGCDPEECIVIEDSPNGIKSGTAAGMKVLAVLHDENGHLDLSGAGEVFENLIEVGEYLRRSDGLYDRRR